MLNVKPLGKVKFDESEILLKLNVIAPIMIVSELIDLIKKNKTDIVNIGSTAGYKAVESQIIYGVSKWAIRGINENLQLELKNTGCRVIGFNSGGFKSKFFEKVGANYDLSNFLDPKEVAKFLSLHETNQRHKILRDMRKVREVKYKDILNDGNISIFDEDEGTISIFDESE